MCVGLPDGLTMMLEATTVGSSHTDSMKKAWWKRGRGVRTQRTSQRANSNVTITYEKQGRLPFICPRDIKQSHARSHVPPLPQGGAPPQPEPCHQKTYLWAAKLRWQEARTQPGSGKELGSEASSPQSLQGQGEKVWLTLKSFSLAKCRIMCLLSLVVLVASNT